MADGVNACRAQQWLRARSLATVEDLDMANCITDSFAIVRRYAGVQCEDFQLSESDCYLERRSMLTPAEQQLLWFGRGEPRFHHTGPDGRTRLILQVVGALESKLGGRQWGCWLQLLCWAWGAGGCCRCSHEGDQGGS